MIRRLRAGGIPLFAAIALTALTGSAPVRAAPLDGAALTEPDLQDEGDRLSGLNALIADLEDPILRQSYQAIGQGEASYYGRELAGNRTASGERFDPLALTAAHRTLPMGTLLRVTNQANGMSVIVRVNDRGPFVRGRIIDVSLGAAQQIQMIRAGKAQVTLEILRNTA